jgi:NH3-dependent NAD+ synthetase
MEAHQARIEANQEEIKVEMNINQEQTKASHEEMMADMKAQTGCLTSRIDVNKEDVRARASAIQYKTEDMIKCSQKKRRPPETPSRPS